jgi:hypothetical protein
VTQVIRDVCPVKGCEHWHDKDDFPTPEAKAEHWRKHISQDHGMNVTVSFGSDRLASIPLVTAEDGLAAILREVSSAPDRMEAVGRWLTKFTNAITRLLPEDAETR